MEDILTQKIGNYIKIFAIGLLSVLLIYNIYENNSSKEQLRQSTKSADSLEAIINKYQSDYTNLKKRADELDSLITIRKDSILIIRKKFYVYRDKEIKNPDQATKYIINFLKD